MKQFINKLLKKTIFKYEYTRIASINGEKTPGFVNVDFTKYDQDHKHAGDPTVNKDIKITPKMRPTVNRVLAGVETHEDRHAFELFILKEGIR